MEADWSVEIGPGLPVIDAAWDGFVDLRRSPEKIDGIVEARQHPALREALLMLNGAGSPLFTNKCDTWTLGESEIDPDEFAATRETAHAGFASYIDIVDWDPGRFASFKLHECWARELTSDLRKLDLRQARVDIVLRAAVFSEQNGFGITLYALCSRLWVERGRSLCSLASDTRRSGCRYNSSSVAPSTYGRVAQLDRAPAF